MKFLSALVVLQTLLVAILLWKVMQPNEPVTIAAPPAQPISGIDPSLNSIPENSNPVQPTALNEAQVRRIIRQELAAVVNDLSASAKADEQAAAVDPVTPAEYQRRLDHVTGQLDHFIGQGTISSAEMADLQSNIARLDPESRQYMLNLLSRAISSGDLEGHF